MANMTSKELKAYAKAGAIAEEVFSSIRTVFAYNGGNYESKRYGEQLRSARSTGIRKGASNGILMGLVWLLIFCVYALVTARSHLGTKSNDFRFRDFGTEEN